MFDVVSPTMIFLISQLSTLTKKSARHLSFWQDQPSAVLLYAPQQGQTETSVASVKGPSISHTNFNLTKGPCHRLVLWTRSTWWTWDKQERMIWIRLIYIYIHNIYIIYIYNIYDILYICVPIYNVYIYRQIHIYFFGSQMTGLIGCINRGCTRVKLVKHPLAAVHMRLERSG